MPTATYKAPEGQLSPAIDLGSSRQIVFPGGKPIKVSAEVAQAILKSEYGKEFDLTGVEDQAPPPEKKTEKPKSAPVGR